MIKGRIYRIVNSKNDLVYIGSTKTSLNERMWHHKWNAHNSINKSKFYHTMEDMGLDLFTIVLIEEIYVNTRKELLQIEESYINDFKIKNPELLLNSNHAYATKKDIQRRKHKDFLRYKFQKKVLYYLKLLPFYCYD